MTEVASGPFSERMRLLSHELRSLEMDLKSGQTPEALQLQEFRHVLDNARLTAWTVSELLNARERAQDPEKVLSFAVAERLRRSNQMLKELCADITTEGVTWQTQGIQTLFDTVNTLQVALTGLIREHRGKFENFGEAAR